VGSHLKRQDGVTEAAFARGRIIVWADSGAGFRIASILRVVREDIGFNPISRIEASVRGRVVDTPSGRMLEVAGTGERIGLEGIEAATGTEGAFEGTVVVGRRGVLRLRRAG